MSDREPFTIEQFNKCLNLGKVRGGKCKQCGKIHFPPRPLCDVCLSKQFEWVEMPTNGTLLTYTIIHIAPMQFQSIAPYAEGIVQLENGVKVPGMIKNVPLEKIAIGMPLKMAIEACSETAQWPHWPRYHFGPI